MSPCRTPNSAAPCGSWRRRWSYGHMGHEEYSSAYHSHFCTQWTKLVFYISNTKFDVYLMKATQQRQDVRYRVIDRTYELKSVVCFLLSFCLLFSSYWSTVPPSSTRSFVYMWFRWSTFALGCFCLCTAYICVFQGISWACRWVMPIFSVSGEREREWMNV